VPEIADWLKALGMSEYAARFAENGIDISVLCHLTDQDLKDIGVLLGHRRKIMAAIAELGRTVPAAPQPALAEAKPHDAAERRQLTVVFCDLVGSTALASRLDPEDLREIIGVYHRCVAETVAPFFGFVAKYMGDGVLMYFGYPQAHEDDAEQAVRAGLALVDAVARLQTPEPLQVRIGIGTGQVIVGDLITSSEGQERGVVGETPNLAARLQAVAEPNAVVIGPQTRLLLGDLFECRDLGAIEVKGFAEPVHTYRVVRESGIQSRFEALHGTTLTPLVAREEEIDLLLRQWHRAKGGEGRVVLLSGEPGIGKSRLAAALQERIENEPHIRLRYFCSPHRQDSALHPFIAQLERAAGFEREDTSEVKLDKLAALHTRALPEDKELLAALLSLPAEDRFPPLQLTPQRRKEKTFRALIRQLEALARQCPVLMLFEDVHWIDPSSRELLDLLVERVPRLPVLLLVTFRPEFQPPWTGQAHVTVLILNRLDRREGAAMVRRVVGNEALSGDVVAEIVRRTDGVPLFVEELTKAVLEGSNVGTASLGAGAAAPNVPATLHASLMARLDRLGSAAKEVAQVGAALGREFSYELLAAVAQRNAAELDLALDQLVVAGLAFRRGVPPQATFVFKHALVQDAAYATLLRGKRQELHGRIAELLVEHFPETAESEPELLARHYAEAGRLEQALAYWQRAGERASLRSANLEAASHFRRGLEAVRSLTDGSVRAEQELQLLIALGPALMMTTTSTAPEIAEIYARARQLASEMGRAAELFPAIWGSCNVAFSSGDLTTSRRLADELFNIARGQDNAGLLLQAHHAAWASVMASGDLQESVRHFDAGIALYRQELHGQHARSFGGHDPGVCALACGAIARCVLGFPDTAIRQVGQAIELARSLTHPPTMVHALWFAAELRVLCREPLAVQELVASLLPLVIEHGSAVGAGANARMLNGWALVLLGRTDEGIRELETGLQVWRESGSKSFAPYRLGRAADAYLVAGRSEQARALTTQALDLTEHSGDRWYEAELHRLQGELLTSMGDRVGAEACFRRALATAHRQQARLLELHAGMSLARLLCEQGQGDAARSLLAPAYKWLTEGFDTPVVKGAKALLDEL
jgi:class 3 adenylate cyclase/predicted ATPase